MSDPTCKQRWLSEKNSEIRTLRKLWTLYSSGNEDGDPDLGRFDEHGLSFDYVAPGTFNNQKRGYWRYQISWGGPSEEFRFYAEGPHQKWNSEETFQYANFRLTRIEYWFLDWFDGYGRKLVGNDESLLREIWDYFLECGVVESEWKKASDE